MAAASSRTGARKRRERRHWRAASNSSNNPQKTAKPIHSGRDNRRRLCSRNPRAAKRRAPTSARAAAPEDRARRVRADSRVRRSGSPAPRLSRPGDAGAARHPRPRASRLPCRRSTGARAPRIRRRQTTPRTAHRRRGLDPRAAGTGRRRHRPTAPRRRRRKPGQNHFARTRSPDACRPSDRDDRRRDS